MMLAGETKNRGKATSDLTPRRAVALAANVSGYALATIYLDQAPGCPESPTYSSAPFSYYWRIPTAETSPSIRGISKPSRASVHRFSVQALSDLEARKLSPRLLKALPPTTSSILRSQPRKTPRNLTSIMADIEMPDAEVGTSSKAKAPAKASKSGPSEAASDGKKRFEVKKACLPKFHPQESMF
jgi:hypothetical protein